MVHYKNTKPLETNLIMDASLRLKEEMSYYPYVLDDMVTVLEECALEPFRLRKNDQSLFAETMKILTQKIVHLPPILQDELMLSNKGRVNIALGYLYQLYFIDAVNARKRHENLKYTITMNGEEWLNLPPKQRLKWILDYFKSQIYPNEDQMDDGFHVQNLNFVPNINYLTIFVNRVEFTRKLVDAFASIADEGLITYEEFFNRQEKSDNPLIKVVRQKSFPSYFTLDQSSAIKRWIETLEMFLFERLVPLGCVKLGYCNNGGIALSITEIGHYLLNDTDDFDYQFEESDTVLIQPNFEVFFPHNSPRAESILAKFAERVGQHVGILFRLTPASVQRAAFSGITAEEILDSLTRLSKKDIPANVTIDIQEWHRQVRYVESQNVLVFQCPDMETASKIKKAGGKKVELLTDTTLMFLEPNKQQSLIRKLNKVGIFVKEKSKA